MSEARLTPGGYRARDTERLHRLHNYCAGQIGQMAGNDDAECLRLLRVLGSLLCETASCCFGSDPEAEGALIADAFWERYQRAIDRSRGDA